MRIRAGRAICSIRMHLLKHRQILHIYQKSSSHMRILHPILPEIVEKPESERGGLLLSRELLKNYRDMCSVPKACDTSPREFPIKCMNILDPLKSDNNLGRSVNKSTLHRIGYAFAFGAEKLKEILDLPGESMGGALEVFFMNTLNRNGKGQRPDINVPVPAFGTGRSEEPVLVGDCDSFYGGLQHVQMCRNYVIPLAPSISPPIPFDADMLKLQQSWLRCYHRGTDVYVPRQTFYHPNAPSVQGQSWGVAKAGAPQNQHWIMLVE